MKEDDVATVVEQPTLDAIKRIAAERGIEFYFAQFVDLYARPSATSSERGAVRSASSARLSASAATRS